MSVQSDDINDVFDRLRDEQPQDIASISNDSNIGSSLSNFGIDRNNPEENQRYIQENQDPLAIIQGIGVVVLNTDGSEINDSGLATSVSRTLSGEFLPEVIEFQGEYVSDTKSELNEIVEPQPGPSSGVRYGYDPKYDESEELAENLQELDISSFDLALGKGYRDQAKIYYDDATSKGLHPETKHVKPLKDIVKKEEIKEYVTEGLEQEDDFWTMGYTLQRIFNLIKDFGEYLQNLEKKEYKKVLEMLNYKKDLNEKEKQIKRNIGTKANRNNLTLQRETISMTRNFLELLQKLELAVKNMKQNSKEGQGEESSESSKPNKDDENKDDSNFDKDGASGFHQTSSFFYDDEHFATSQL